MPKVFNKYRDIIPAEAVSIMRPSKWGNPFIVGRHGTREEVVLKYETWILSSPKLVAAAQKELRGKDLVCCCAPKDCHGYVLLEIANRDWPRVS